MSEKDNMNHNELENEVEKVKEILYREMEGAAKLSIPLIASASTGHSWYEAK